MVLEYYYDLLSQPCRAVYLFLKANNIDFEAKEIQLLKGEHKSPEFTKKNPYSKVPLIIDGDFILAESVAIMRYVANKYNIAEHWYPRKDLQKQAKVDEFLNWQHLCVRKPCLDVFLPKFRHRIGVGALTKEPCDEAKLQECRDALTKSVTHIADYFLGDNPYIAGDEISAADLLGVCELFQISLVEEEGLYTNNEKVNAWVERVRERLQPDFETSCEKIMGIKQQFLNAKE